MYVLNGLLDDRVKRVVKECEGVSGIRVVSRVNGWTCTELIHALLIK